MTPMTGNPAGPRHALPLAGLAGLHGIVFSTIWLVLPDFDEKWVMAVILAAVLAISVWLVRRTESMPPATVDFNGRHAPVDLLIVLVPVAIAYAADGGLRLSQLAAQYPATLLGYLFYAWFQLFLFLELPLRVLRPMDLRPGRISLVCALLFALVHLPNPLLMAVTGLAMWIFSWQYQRGRSMIVLVVLMAVTATNLKIAVPEDVTAEMRIGPDYLEHTVP